MTASSHCELFTFGKAIREKFPKTAIDSHMHSDVEQRAGELLTKLLSRNFIKMAIQKTQ